MQTLLTKESTLVVKLMADQILMDAFHGDRALPGVGKTLESKARACVEAPLLSL